MELALSDTDTELNWLRVILTPSDSVPECYWLWAILTWGILIANGTKSRVILTLSYCLSWMTWTLNDLDPEWPGPWNDTVLSAAYCEWYWQVSRTLVILTLNDTDHSDTDPEWLCTWVILILCDTVSEFSDPEWHLALTDTDPEWCPEDGDDGELAGLLQTLHPLSHLLSKTLSYSKNFLWTVHNNWMPKVEQFKDICLLNKLAMKTLKGDCSYFSRIM
jgi:hypothetical protein